RHSLILSVIILFFYEYSSAQETEHSWIRPETTKDPAVWGLRNGIVFGLWPSSIESARKEMSGGPRGLIQVGYEFKGRIYNMNFIAVEPVVNGKMEFSEISPSKIDGKWGKLMWTGSKEDKGTYFPSAINRGIISHPDPGNPNIEQLTIYL